MKTVKIIAGFAVEANREASAQGSSGLNRVGIVPQVAALGARFTNRILGDVLRRLRPRRRTTMGTPRQRRFVDPVVSPTWTKSAPIERFVILPTIHTRCLLKVGMGVPACRPLRRRGGD